MINFSTIRRLILEGEGVELDFKKTITSKEKIAKTLVAFANNRGGKLLIGVGDEGGIKGVKSIEEEKYMISQAAQVYCRPPVEVNFHEVNMDDKTILVAEILRGHERPYYALDEAGKWWVYVRVNDKSVLASKIVMDVLKNEAENKNVLIEYSSKEKALLEYLEQHEKITLAEFCNLINISRRKASPIIVNLILSGIIKVNTTEKTEFYTAS